MSAHRGRCFRALRRTRRRKARQTIAREREVLEVVAVAAGVAKTRADLARWSNRMIFDATRRRRPGTDVIQRTLASLPWARAVADRASMASRASLGIGG